MTEPSVVDRVLKIVADVAGPSRTPPDAGAGTPLCDGGFWLDSLALLELVMACEAEFDFDFDPGTEIAQAKRATVGSLAAIITERRPRR
jgi:acyl carrier protein